MLSICIPAYKHVALTYEAAKSVLQQDVDIELLILDDFYLLDTTSENLDALEELKDYLQADNRVKCISNEKLLPIQENWNKAVTLCSGKYIKLMGADDRILSGGIAQMLEMITEKPSIAFHAHLAEVIDADGYLIRRQRQYDKSFVDQPITGVTALKGKLRQQARFKEPVCNFYLKSAWEQVGGYDNKFRFAFDVHFNSKMMFANKSMLWNKYLVELRRHKASDGSQLPASLALADLKGVVDEILLCIGADVSIFDRAAGNGCIQYRLIELMAQRLKLHPSEAFNLLAMNISLFATNPMSLYWMSKLVFHRLVYDDVQQ